MSLYQQHRNRLLSELRHDDYGFIAPYLREVPLARGLLLQEQEAPVEKVYFPITGVISLVSVMERGEW
jgi:hypothetical protein